MANHHGNTTVTLIRQVLEEKDTLGVGRVKMTMATLSEETRRTERSLQKALAKLYANGVLETEYDPETGERIFVILRRPQ